MAPSEDKFTQVRRYKSRTQADEWHRVRRNQRTGQLSCSCKGWEFHKHCWHVAKVLEGGYHV